MRLGVDDSQVPPTYEEMFVTVFPEVEGLGFVAYEWLLLKLGSARPCHPWVPTLLVT